MKTTMRNIFVLICVFAVVAVVHGNAESTRLKKSNQTCGVPKLRSGLIFRGQSFSRGDFPWLVALIYKKTEPPTFFCSGTLLSTTFVLSAAHCISQKGSDEILLARDVFAFFGAHNLSNLYEAGRFALSPKEITIHDKWNPGTIQYDADLSLLEFEKGSIHFNDFVQPICLLYSENDSPATEGDVVGWGQSEDPYRSHENIPKLITVQIASNEDCLPGEPRLADLASRTTFCAGLKNGSGVCRGDSGGGLFIKVGGVHYLRGIVSSGLLNGNDCDILKFAIYTNVLKFRHWIEKITESDPITSAIQATTASTKRPTVFTRPSTKPKRKKTTSQPSTQAITDDPGFGLSDLGFRVKHCRNDSDCNSRGYCVNGHCVCDIRENPEEIINGQFCECDNFTCDRHNLILCSGPHHGECECGVCKCLDGWVGAACECSSSIDTCKAPNGEICSNHGECRCGSCECDDVEDIRYFGQYCEKCPTCPGRCYELKDCVECQMYKKGMLKKPKACEKNCTLFVPILVDAVNHDEGVDEHLCQYYDEDDCRYQFVYSETVEKNGTLTLHVRAQPLSECPEVHIYAKVYNYFAKFF